MKKIESVYLLILSLCPLFCWNNEPQPVVKTSLTVIIIVDQLAYQFVQKLEKYFTGGIRFLLDNGVVYKNAYHPHGLPATATGFAAFNTGTFARYHGMINNIWFDKEGKEVVCDDDTSGHAAVFSKKGLYNYGKSAKNIMIDGISDTIILDSQPYAENRVFSLSHKSRSAICLAGKLGKAIWFDTKAGQFTSSKAYFTQLPVWLRAFNDQLGVHGINNSSWTLLYPETHPVYYVHNVKSTVSPKKNCVHAYRSKDIYNRWIKTPAANKLLLDLTKACIQQHIAETSGHLLVWVGLSSLDFVGHTQGLESREAIDLVLQLDQQLKDFFSEIEQFVPAEQTLYLLSADHGVEPIPERLMQLGMPAYHHDVTVFIRDINRAIAEKHGIANIVRQIYTPHIYLNEKVLQALSRSQKNNIISDIIAFVKQQPGIHTAWSYDELMHIVAEPYQFEAWYKNQLYPGRSGAIIFQPLPYYQFTNKTYCTTHETPYECNTHVPLIMYQKGRFKPRVIFDKVWALQVPNTLAYLLTISKPSASTVDMLPGLLPYTV